MLIEHEFPADGEYTLTVKGMTGYFTAVLGKLRGITPDGWRTAAGYYGEPDTFRSVADIVDSDSLQKVRETKKSVKAAKKASASQMPG